jgi:serine-type D-Ala-D-Ala carboxypeptidase (penicillin-binding protein 5/6)
MRAVLRLAVAAVAIVCTAAAAEVSLPASAQAAPSRAAAVPAGTAPAGVVAAAGELVNVASGRILWRRKAKVELPIASITKLMTALVVLSDGHLNRKIRVTQAAETYAEDNGAGSADLVPGDVLTTRELLDAMLLPSGADAAYLLAHSYGPWRAFVRKMNRMAARLGLTQTHFANFDGLPWPTEYSTYSTPQDLIRLGAAAMSHPVLRRIVSRRHFRLRATSQHHAYRWANTDRLLFRYKGAIGIKTGFTSAAGYCLLFEATRDGRTLMGVVLDSTNTDAYLRFSVAVKLLNWGFLQLS